MLSFSTNQLATMNKGDLRTTCRELGVSYQGMNVDGMRAALATHASDAEGQPVVLGDVTHLADTVEVTADTVVAPELQNAPEPVEPAVVVREPRVLPTIVPPIAPAPTVAPVRKVQSNRPEANGVKRPSDGTICAQIWAWCDDTYEAGVRPEAKALRAALPALDDTTKTVQFYRWRKFNGIQGR